MTEPSAVRTEPWSQGESCRGVSRAYAAIPDSRHNDTLVRVCPPGASAYRTHLVDSAGNDIWELPYLERIAVGSSLDLEVLAHGQRSIGPLPMGISDHNPKADDSPEWLALVSHHVEHCCRWGESTSALDGAVQAEGCVHVDWATFLSEYWTGGDRKDPPRHLIVQIAQECAPWITDLCNRPRRVLRRERQEVAVSKAQDLDDACIRWLSRQPGRRLAERAGPLQRLMAVVREQSFDTAENRVLRDFLRLSVIASRRYLHQYVGFAESRRTYDVRIYLSHVERLLRHSPLANVPALVGFAERNYVLQFDPRYGQMWQWYERLRRQEDDRDNLAQWRHRTWAEYCELLVARSCEVSRESDKASIRLGHGSFQSPIVLRHEADHGRFVDARWQPGPWSLRTGEPQELLRVVRSRALRTHPSMALRGLGPLAPDFVLVASRVFDESRVAARVPVWTIFSPGESDEDVAARLERASTSLRSTKQDQTSGLLLVPAKTGTRNVLQSRDGFVTCVRVGLPESEELTHAHTLLTRVVSSLVSGRPM